MRDEGRGMREEGDEANESGLGALSPFSPGFLLLPSLEMIRSFYCFPGNTMTRRSNGKPLSFFFPNTPSQANFLGEHEIRHPQPGSPTSWLPRTAGGNCPLGYQALPAE